MNGLKRGLQLMMDFLKLRYKMFDEGRLDEEAQADFANVESIWLQEFSNTKSIQAAIKKGKVDDGIFIAVLLGRDPFKGSREAFRALQGKYPAASSGTLLRPSSPPLDRLPSDLLRPSGGV